MSLDNKENEIIYQQKIISTEDKIVLHRRISLAASIISKAVLPTLINLYYFFVRNQQILIDNLYNQILPSALTFLANSISTSLSSVQRGITYSINRNEINNRQDKETFNVAEKTVEVKILHEPCNEIKADVIFIHGLHGGLDRTWTQGVWRHNNHKLKDQLPMVTSSGDMHVPPRKTSLKRTISELYGSNKAVSKKYQKTNCDACIVGESRWEIVECGETVESDGFSGCWPQDWIPQDCPDVRVIALNYSTDMLWCPIWLRQRCRSDIVERSNEMIDELLKIGVGKRPIVWAGHSKGGLYIKQIIINALDSKNDHIDCIRKQTKAIMFYSVPHKGSLLADITFPLMRRSIELIEVQRNGANVLNLNKRFLEASKNGDISAEIFSFIETSFTLMTFVFLKIIPFDSADLGIGTRCTVPLDHREICKPAGRDCFLYLELIKLINKALNKSVEEVH